MKLQIFHYFLVSFRYYLFMDFAPRLLLSFRLSREKDSFNLHILTSLLANVYIVYRCYCFPRQSDVGYYETRRNTCKHSLYERSIRTSYHNKKTVASIPRKTEPSLSRFRTPDNWFASINICQSQAVI